MKLSLVERETILLYNQAEPMAEVYTHDPRLMEKLELLAKKHPDQITRKDAHNFTVPKRCGITIIAPTPYKKKIEEQKLDPDTKAPILDKDGKIVTEEKEIEIPMFRPVKVFDVSQTDGKPLLTCFSL